MADHDDCYTLADLRELCLALASEYDHQALNATRAASTASSGVSRNRLVGRADAYETAARIARQAAPRIDNP